MEQEKEVELKISSLDTLGPYLSTQDTVKNVVYLSDIPQICQDEPCMLGVDEAGRGPVLGPMVYGIAYCPLGKSDTLKELGCADSKQLTESERDEIFNNLTTTEPYRSTIGWAVELISPTTISTSMLRRAKHSLNELSMDSAISLIQQAADAGVNIAEVYVDTVGPPEKYQAKLSKIFPYYQITVAKKADSTFPIVSAASICAKVTRDHALKVWTFREGIDVEQFGSGYPGDPVTKTFLKDFVEPVFGYTRLVRFSWATATNALEQTACNVEFEDPSKDEKAEKGSQSIKSFFKGEKRQRHTFFTDRCLNCCSDI